MTRDIKDFNFDDIDLSDYEEEIREINATAEELFNDPSVKRMMKKHKKKMFFRKINDFIELVIDYGFWNVITGKAKREYLDLDYFDDEEDEE